MNLKLVHIFLFVSCQLSCFALPSFGVVDRAGYFGLSGAFFSVLPASDSLGNYPVITQEEVKDVGGEQLRLVTANGIRAFVAGKFKDSYKVLEGLKISNTKFRAYNDMSVYETLQPGKVYYLKKKKARGPVFSHTAVRGESIWDISQRYGVRVARVLYFNRMADNERLKPGRVVLLQKRRKKKSKPEYKPLPILKKKPGKPTLQKKAPPKTASTKTPSAQKAQAKQQLRYHILGDKETLEEVSKKYGISVEALRKLNDLKPQDSLMAGTVLRVQGGAAEPKHKPADSGQKQGATKTASAQKTKGRAGDKKQGEKPRQKETGYNPLEGLTLIESPAEKPAQQKSNVEEILHKVSKGETLYRIAALYDVDEDQIVAWNSLSSRSLKEGDRLKIVQVTMKDDMRLGNRRKQKSSKPRETLHRKTTAVRQQAEVSVAAQKTPNHGQLPASAPLTHRVAAGETLYSIAKRYKLSVQDLTNWNGIGNSNSIPKGKVLRLSKPAYTSQATDFWPTETEVEVENAAMSRPSGLPQIAPEGYHFVRKGETIGKVAFRYNATEIEIRAWNNLADGQKISPGQQLVVNKKLAESIDLAKEKPSGEGKKYFHRVQKNETLYSISKKNNVSVNQIKQWNNLKSTEIAIGQQLIVGYMPGTNDLPSSVYTQPKPTENRTQYHSVHKGETFYSIAKKYGLSVQQLKQLNNKSDNTLRVGESLRVAF